MKERGQLLLLFLFFSFSFMAPGIAAQESDVPVVVMPFVGDNAEVTMRMGTISSQEVDKVAGYIRRSLSVDMYPEITELPPDEPPDPSYLGDSPLVMTGEWYLDTDDLQHVQLWLWNSDSGSLVYTDELVAEDEVEAEGYIETLVAWIFSKIPTGTEEEELAPEEEELALEEEEWTGNVQMWSAPPEEPFFQRLYVGGRLGGGLDIQVSRAVQNYEGSTNQSLGAEAAITVEYQPWRYLSFQGEAIFLLSSFTVFRVSVNDDEAREDHFTERHMIMSLFFPLLFKMPVRLGSMNMAIMGGAYFILPIRSTKDGTSYISSQNLPLGIGWGLEVGHTLGPGELYGTLRYSLDLGTITADTDLHYTHSRLSLSVGYKFDLLPLLRKKNRSGSENVE
jgi:hypothetical protein